MDNYTFEILDATADNLFKYINEDYPNCYAYLLHADSNGFRFIDVDDIKIGDITNRLDNKHKILFIHE